MEYTPTQRLKRIWELTRKDSDCAACLAELEKFEAQMAEYTDLRPDAQALWAYPVSIQIYFGRVLEVISEQLRLPEEL